MLKSELIESIQRLNPTASTEFLASFSEEELIAYLRQLQEVNRPCGGRETGSLLLAG